MNPKHVVVGLCVMVFGCTLPFILMGCEKTPSPAKTENVGVQQRIVETPVDMDGETVEQKNVKRRILEDNKVGSIKYLYLLNPTTSECILFSPVKGKVTSGGKRLLPREVACGEGEYWGSEYNGTRVGIHGSWRRTGEVLNDDGTYGSSGDYLYWFTPDDRYFQIYVGASTVLISDRPIRVKKIGINLQLK